MFCFWTIIVFIIHFKKISVVCCYLQSLFIHESEQSVHTHIYIYKVIPELLLLHYHYHFYYSCHSYQTLCNNKVIMQANGTISSKLKLNNLINRPIQTEKTVKCHVNNSLNQSKCSEAPVVAYPQNVNTGHVCKYYSVCTLL